MFCPNCGNEMDLFADRCLSCGTSFKGMSLAERQKLQRNPRVHNTQRIHYGKSGSAVRVTETRIEYNGIPCRKGMSFSGKRIRRGSFKKRANNEGIGFRLPHCGVVEYNH